MVNVVGVPEASLAVVDSDGEVSEFYTLGDTKVASAAASKFDLSTIQYTHTPLTRAPVAA